MDYRISAESHRGLIKSTKKNSTSAATEPSFCEPFDGAVLYIDRAKPLSKHRNAFIQNIFTHQINTTQMNSYNQNIPKSACDWC